MKLRLVTEEAHSVRADQLATAGLPRISGNDIAQLTGQAHEELLQAIAQNDLALLIAAERRLVAIGALAQLHANHLERK